MVAIDGTRLAGNASRERNREFGQIAEEIVEQVKATDEAEDEEFGEARGDELPEQLRTPEGRREFFRRAKRRLARRERGRGAGRGGRSLRHRRSRSSSLTPSGSWRVFRVARGGCVTRSVSSSGIAGSIPIRLRARARSGCCWRPSGWRTIWPPSARGTRRMSITAWSAGTRRAAGLPARRAPYQPPEVPAGKVNVTDPDSQADQGERGVRAGLQRAGGRRSEPDRARGGDHQQHRRLVTARADGRRDPRRARAGWLCAAGSRRRSRTPSTGTSSTWTRSSPTSTCRC